jgi:hypothetical protein
VTFLAHKHKVTFVILRAMALLAPLNPPMALEFCRSDESFQWERVLFKGLLARKPIVQLTPNLKRLITSMRPWQLSSMQMLLYVSVTVYKVLFGVHIVFRRRIPSFFSLWASCGQNCRLQLLRDAAHCFHSTVWCVFSLEHIVSE